jgi:AAA domain
MVGVGRVTAPMFSFRHGRYTAEWGDPDRAILVFDLVRAERSGDVTAEIEVTSTAPAVDGVIHMARVNLVGTRSRQELAKHLTTRTNGIGTDWPTVVEIACREVLRAYRAGAPAVLLRDVAPPSEEETGYALAPLVLSGLPTCIFGDGGSAKSMLALAIGAAIHTGRPLAGFTPERPRRVGLLDWEMDAHSHRDRLGRLTGEPLPDLVYVPCARPLAEDVDRLRRIVARHELEFLIADSVALACDGPPEAAEVATRFFGALRDLGLPVLCIAHVNRSGDTDRPFGSAFWHNGFRLTWYAKRETDPSPDTLAVGLFAKKANLGPMPAPVGFRLAFSSDGIDLAGPTSRSWPTSRRTFRCGFGSPPRCGAGRGRSPRSPRPWRCPSTR